MKIGVHIDVGKPGKSGMIILDVEPQVFQGQMKRVEMGESKWIVGLMDGQPFHVNTDNVIAIEELCG